MEFDFSKLAAKHRYKLLVGLVVPRPIALVSTVGKGGVVNAAPFSFFNVLGDDPPILIVSIEDKASGDVKDTARNILDTGEFVVNLVDEATVERMHDCSQDFPPEISEPEQVGFTTLPSRAVRPPRLAEAPVAMECKLLQHILIGGRRHLVIGEIVWMHTQEGIVDPENLRVRMENYFPVGRLYADRYSRTRDLFAVQGNPDYLESVRRAGRL
jgi:flavin reductase (DIM6/NTAB) family NADH-FMN oxidoreductase RutF